MTIMSSLFKMATWLCILMLLVPVAVATPNGEQPPPINKEHEGTIGVILAITSYTMILCIPEPTFFVLGTMIAIGSMYLIYDSTT